MKNIMENKIKNFWLKNKFYLIIFIVVLLIFSPFLNNLYIWGHDTDYHISNIIAIMQNIDISEGKIFPDKIVPLIANDFGWGSGIFYPSLPHYITVYVAIFLSLFNISVISAMKVCHFIAVLLSGIFMFWLLKKKTKNNYAALISSIIYITFPYFITDIFVRDAYAESFIFIFIPLIFLGLEYLLEKNYKKFYLFFVIGYVGVMNCHLVLSVYLTIFLIIFLILNYKLVLKKEIIKKLFISAFLILLFTSPFTFPLVEHTLKGDYTVYIKNHMFTINEVIENTVNFMQYFNMNWSNYEVVRTISYSGLLCFLLVLINLKTFNDKTLKSYIILVFVALIFLSPLFPWSKMPSILLNIQFVWRLETFLAFFISVVAGYSVYLISKKNLKNITTIIIFISLFFTFSFVNVENITNVSENSINHSISGTDNSYQYIPTNAYENIGYFLNRNDKIKVKKGSANIKVISDNTPNLKFKIKTDGATIEIPRFFFFGYDISLNTGKDNIKIAYKENNKGFIEFTVPKTGTVTVEYNGTICYRLSLLLFGFATIISLIYLVKTKKQ